MERFKVVERETKTKAYSKEGMCTYLVPLTSTLAYFYLLPSLSYSFILPLHSIYLFSFHFLSSPLPLFSSSHFHFTLILPSSSFLLYLSSPMHIPPLTPQPHSLSSTHTSYIHLHSVYQYLPLLYTYVILHAHILKELVLPL